MLHVIILLFSANDDRTEKRRFTEGGSANEGNVERFGSAHIVLGYWLDVVIDERSLDEKTMESTVIFYQFHTDPITTSIYSALITSKLYYFYCIYSTFFAGGGSVMVR